MISRWIKYRCMRFFIHLKNRSKRVMKNLEVDDHKMDTIQKLVYSITIRLIHDPNSELRSNSIDDNYHIENDNYLIIIRPQSGNYSINIIEYKTRQLINNFDVPFGAKDIKILINNYDREVHKRMKNRMMMKTSKVAKHLQSILSDIEDKQKIVS